MKHYLPLFAVILFAYPALAQDQPAVPVTGQPATEQTAASRPPVAADPVAASATVTTAPHVNEPPAPIPDPSWRPGKSGAHVKPDASEKPAVVHQDERFQWSAAIKQSLLFLGVQHGYAMTQPKTRDALGGSFMGDYLRSVRRLGGWGDGGRFFTNYVAHPMQGSLTGLIQVQNDPKGRKLHFGNTKPYWVSRLKATAWTAAWSTQFEIGPLSQASIGNVGMHGKQTWVDLVITPTVGSAMLVSEDAIDRFVIRKLERRYPKNFWLKIFARMLLNPTRTVANAIAFREPWHRHTQR